MGALFALALGMAPGVAAGEASVLVFAAASTTEAVSEAARLFAARGGGRVRASFASSSTLARQIEQGAPADLFISANPKWMDFLEARGLIVPASRFDLLGNRLVLVAPADSAAAPVPIGEGFPLAEMLGGRRLAMGDPDHVPAGIYAREALRSLGVWAEVAERLARTGDVRGALALVARGETPFGIVYASDAAAAPGVTVVGAFPQGSHPPITYPAALVAGRETSTARAFLAFLATPEARSLFERHGFAVEPRP